MSEVNIDSIRQAYERLKGIVHHTPLDYSRTFSRLSGCEAYLKLENLQKTGSFKIRGAYNKIQTLSEQEKARGVIAASAGNHAQGVAFGARQAGLKATIVMPEIAPLAKVVATRDYQAEVVLKGTVYDEAYQEALKIQQETGSTFVHAFNDSAVIAGQGTIGLEILQDLPDVDAIVVPIGGGGLIAGIASAVKAVAPHVKIYGVQAQGASAMYLSKAAHSHKTTNDAVTIADGIAVKVPGDLTFAIVDRLVDEIVTVDDEDIAGSILLLLERSKMMVEGAGAVSLAALIHDKIPCKRKVVCVISGGNIDVNFISRIIERGLVKAGRRIKICTNVLDRPGELQRLLYTIGKLQGNIIHVYHDRVERHVPLGQAVVEISLETRDAMHSDMIMQALSQQGYVVELIV